MPELSDIIQHAWPITKWSLIVLGGLTFLLGCPRIIPQQQVGVVERLGKYVRTMSAGFNLKWPLIESVVGTRSLKVQQLDIKVKTKTKDNVFVTLKIAVQFCAQPDKIFEAFYKLWDRNAQLKAYVNDAVLSTVPELDLDEVFSQKATIGTRVMESLGEKVGEYGYTIVSTLITDIAPPDEVEESMNRINAAQREQTAAKMEGEAEKIKMTKVAEGHKLAKILQGEGVAGQRKAIADGLKESVEALNGSGVNPAEVMNILLLTQYLDTLRDVAEGESNTILLPVNPGGVAGFSQEIMSFTAANLAADASKPPPIPKD